MTKSWARGSSLLTATLSALTVLAGALNGGCSLIFHVDANQCSTTPDCQARGAAFDGYTCKQGQCIPPVAMTDAGDGGVQCMVNNDCVGMFTTPDFACDVSTHTCLPLTTSDCPVYIGDISSTTAPPIFIGSFVVFPTAAGAGTLTHPSYINYKMALSEFAMNGPGIPAGPPTGPARRTPVAIACDAQGNTSAAMQHLINDVHVPVVVTAFDSSTLATTFSQFDPAANVFFVDALGANSSVEPPALPTNGLLWHMLGQPGDVAPAYAAFLPLLESYVRQTAPWNLGALPTPLRVAAVTSKAIETQDLDFAVKQVIQWNGGLDVITNGNNGNFQEFTIDDSSLNNTDPMTIDTATPALAIAAFKPNVILSFTSEEFVYLFQNLEVDWDPGTPFPFYVLGPYNYLSTNLAAQVPNYSYSSSGQETPNSLRVRLAGITVASPDDTRSLQVFNTYKTNYPGSDVNESNYYDAMYFAVYSLVAAGRKTGVTGNDVENGMQQLISLSGPQYGMGPTPDMGNIFSTLAVGQSLGLTGTLGPPDFNSAKGARVGAGDVYCLGKPAVDGGPDQYMPDVLRLTDAGAGPDGSDFSGTFPCFPGLQ